MAENLTKEEVLAALEESLQAELQRAVGASKEAADYATNEEARAESKWDTQGLEASYLAAGQANKARQWAEAIELLRRSRDGLAAPKDEVTLGALVVCEMGGSRELFFVAPAAGGHVLTLRGLEVTVITPQSPIAGRILGRRAGEGFSLPDGAAGAVVSIS